jgi:hypothetical protein
LPPDPCDSGQQLVAKGFEAYMHAEADKWAPVLKDANITVQ